MRDFKNNCFNKEFSLISTEKKAIVDILFFWDNKYYDVATVLFVFTAASTVM